MLVNLKGCFADVLNVYSVMNEYFNNYKFIS